MTTYPATDLMGNPIIPPGDIPIMYLCGDGKNGKVAKRVTAAEAFKAIREAIAEGVRNLRWGF